MARDHFNDDTVGRLITRGPGFNELYADSGLLDTPAPRHRATVKFNDAIDQMTDEDLAAIREFDRNRSGGFYRA